MLTIFPRLRKPFVTALSALLLAAAPHLTCAQSNTTITGFFAIGAEHAQTKPYSFSGRLFALDEVGFGTATLIRRHTALTAGHVVFGAVLGFATNLTFSRGLYGNTAVSRQQVSSVAVLAGYQNFAVTEGENTLDSFSRDQGLIILMDPPVDETHAGDLAGVEYWGNFLPDPSELTKTFSTDTKATNQQGFFILGYPGATFDGRTMAYIVPLVPFVQIGAASSGAYINDSYAAEGGFSGGPVYVSPDGRSQYVVADLVGGLTDPTGEFNFQNVRAITKESAHFLRDAEYTTGLIKRVKINGPKLAARGVPLTYKLVIKFAVPNPDGSPATTDRYPELRLTSDILGTANASAIKITKISNLEFQVTFSNTLRSGSTVNLTVVYDKSSPAPQSLLAVRLQ